MPDVDCYLGEIRLFPYPTRVPVDWVPCDGRTLKIADFAPLYSLIGTTYGGDGNTTFAIPNLKSRLPIGDGQGPGLSSRVLGQTGGVTDVTLTIDQIPAHTHSLNASKQMADTTMPTRSSAFATLPNDSRIYNNSTLPTTGTTTFGADTVGNEGQNVAHSNMMPTIVMNYFIAIRGEFPPFE